MSGGGPNWVFRRKGHFFTPIFRVTDDRKEGRSGRPEKVIDNCLEESERMGDLPPRSFSAHPSFERDCPMLFGRASRDDTRMVFSKIVASSETLGQHWGRDFRKFVGKYKSAETYKTYIGVLRRRCRQFGIVTVG